MMNFKKTTLAVLAGTLLSGGVWAATDGSLGSTSSGTTDIDFTVSGGPGAGGSILIDKLDDISLGTFNADSPAAGLQGFSNFCVYKTGSPSGFDFNLTTTSGKGVTNFELHKDGVATPTEYQKVKYAVSFSSDDNNGVNGTELTNKKVEPVSADESVGLVIENNTYTCSGENVSILVTANLATASTAEAGTYKDTLTLLVAPR
ncbi:hypothetical protein ACH42_07780 [Endozoicomonas sp. (ex Bugula neritina AB1)]|nr:hypothetical protein ACH42_07780 [Endozoicomonas sp. (ex Bugula neritina AB1)]